MAVDGKMLIWSNLGQNPSEMGVRKFARIKKLIWEQLLVTKDEILQSSAVFSSAFGNRRF